MDIEPVESLSKLTEQGLESFLKQKFSKAFGPEVPGKLEALYKDITAIAPAYTVYAVDADTGVSCGHRALMSAARQGFKSPVYWGIVVARPEHDDEGKRFPFHGWSFQAASRNFALYTPTA